MAMSNASLPAEPADTHELQRSALWLVVVAANLMSGVLLLMAASVLAR
jgi:hypothetical protein